MITDWTDRVLTASLARGTDRFVLTVLSLYADPDGRAWPGYKTLGEKTQLSPQVLIDSLRRLVALGEISIAASGRSHHATVYQFVAPRTSGIPAILAPRSTAAPVNPFAPEPPAVPERKKLPPVSIEQQAVAWAHRDAHPEEYEGRPPFPFPRPEPEPMAPAAPKPNPNSTDGLWYPRGLYRAQSQNPSAPEPGFVTEAERDAYEQRVGKSWDESRARDKAAADRRAAGLPPLLSYRAARARWIAREPWGHDTPEGMTLAKYQEQCWTNFCGSIVSSGDDPDAVKPLDPEVTAAILTEYNDPAYMAAIAADLTEYNRPGDLDLDQPAELPDVHA